MFAGNFTPDGWLACDGQLVSIAENTALFQLIGTTYGGDGMATFGIPDMRGRVPLHQGGGLTLGEAAGSEQITLTVAQIPAHNHPFRVVASPGDTINPNGNLPANSLNVKPYINQAPDGNMASAAIGPAGGSQPHNNLQPSLCITFIIAQYGRYPTQT
jgi:microcystin-dependent protein